MRDIKNAKLLYFKGFLFLFGCVISSILIFIEIPRIKTAVLIFIALWCAARFYYFMFYVIENYIDGEYKFSGVGSLVKYLYNRKDKKKI